MKGLTAAVEPSTIRAVIGRRQRRHSLRPAGHGKRVLSNVKVETEYKKIYQNPVFSFTQHFGHSLFESKVLKSSVFKRYIMNRKSGVQENCKVHYIRHIYLLLAIIHLINFFNSVKSLSVFWGIFRIL